MMVKGELGWGGARWDEVGETVWRTVLKIRTDICHEIQERYADGDDWEKILDTFDLSQGAHITPGAHAFHT